MKKSALRKLRTFARLAVMGTVLSGTLTMCRASGVCRTAGARAAAAAALPL